MKGTAVPPRPAPPLPQPTPPAAAGRALAEAARAAASTWAQPLDPAAHGRAVSQLHSIVRDLGIATRGLAAYQAGSLPAGLEDPDFARHATAGARQLTKAWQHLDAVLAAEGIPPSTDPDEPGAALCQAARDAILAWRQPSGTAADRDATVRQLVTATGTLSMATSTLADCASRRPAIRLQAAADSLTAALTCLAAAIPSAENASSEGPARGQ
jgi:hypothetical protein